MRRPFYVPVDFIRYRNGFCHHLKDERYRLLTLPAECDFNRKALQLPLQTTSSAPVSWKSRHCRNDELRKANGTVPYGRDNYLVESRSSRPYGHQLAGIRHHFGLFDR